KFRTGTKKENSESYIDLALKAIQPPRHIKAPANKASSRGHRGPRRLISNSTIQSASAASKIQLVVWMPADVVAP
ncbi:MAG: hypothetical protein DMF26_16245, partial [Verrucomicrobia bacterium]